MTSVWCVLTQGRHTKTGQLAAIKVMNVTEVGWLLVVRETIVLTSPECLASCIAKFSDIVDRVETIPLSGIGYWAIPVVSILVWVLPLYSHGILVYCSVPGQVLSRPFPSPANTTRQLASLFAAATADREALPSWCAYIVRLMRCSVMTTSYDSLMTSCDDVTLRRAVSVSVSTRYRYHHACGIVVSDIIHCHGRYCSNTYRWCWYWGSSQRSGTWSMCISRNSVMVREDTVSFVIVCIY